MREDIILHAAGEVTNSYELLGQSGLTTPNQLFSSSRVSIVSANAGDSVSGVGVQKVSISGYNNGSAQFEEVDMNGTTTVTTTASFDLIRSISVSGVGTSGQQGDITASVFGGNTILVVKKGYLSTHDAVIYLANTYYVDHIDITGDSTDSNTIYEVNIMRDNGTENVILYTMYWDTDKSIHDYSLDYIPIQGLIWVRCKNLKHNGPDNVSISIHLHKKATLGVK
jgi:hypothetical protein